MNFLLEVEPLNFKALFLRGQAYCQLNELEQAYEDLSQAHDLEPTNELIKRHL
jgi:hypothetical protein